MGLRQMVPASSRSFWQLYGEFERLQEEVRGLHAKNDELISAVRGLSSNLEAHDVHTKMMLWEALREGGEDLAETKKRFFADLPAAEGADRVVQLALAHLMSEFDQLCAELNLPYWVACGTALGAMRHGGFVPWDDDVDLGMIRQDIDTLAAAAAEGDRYRVTVVFDRKMKCRQVRFRYRDKAIPCFLDLFIFDYVIDPAHATFERMQVDRRAFVERVDASSELDFWQVPRGYVKIEDEGGDVIARYFDEAVEEEYAQEGFLTRSRDEAGGIMWGVDNLDSWDRLDWISPIEDVFPLRRVPFEGGEVYAMANLEGYLREHYGDIYSLPKDIKSHFSHIRGGKLDNPDTRRALEELTGQRLP